MSAVPAFADPSSISAKEAEVQSVLNQIDQLDGSLERAIEAYNLATDKLHAIEGDLQTNLRELHIAKANLGRSQKALSKRLVSIYTSGDDTSSTLGILLGAGTIDDMLSQIETVNRVSNQDLRINRQIIEFKGSGQAAPDRAEERRGGGAVARPGAFRPEGVDSSRSFQSAISGRLHPQRHRADEAGRRRQRQAELARQARERAAEAANAPAPIVSTWSTAAPPATTPSPVAPPSSGGGNGTLVSIAMRYLGIPYVYAGDSPSGGFDCSGLHDVRLRANRHLAPAQRGHAVRGGDTVSRDALEPGDLVFFYGLGHVGMYIGGGNFIHAPHTGDVVKISSLAGHYDSVFDGARRYT